jgi:hypothetical protein
MKFNKNLADGEISGTKTMSIGDRQVLAEQAKMFGQNKKNKLKNFKDNISPDINVFTCTIGRRAT